MNNFIRVTQYGTEKEAIDHMVYVPHGDTDVVEFLSKIPESHGVYDAFSAEELTRYNRMEVDIGTPEVAHSLGKLLQERHPEKSTVVVEALCPRNFLDMNRYADQTVKHTFDAEKYPEYHAALLDIYNQVIAVVERFMARSTITFHVHSMCPNNLHKWPEITPHLNQFCKEFIAIKNQSTRRKTDVFWRDENKVEILQKQYVDQMIAALQRRNIPYDIDKPYAYLSYGIMHKQSQLWDSIAIDIVKSDMCTNGPEDFHDPSALIIDPKKAEVFAQVLYETYYPPA